MIPLDATSRSVADAVAHYRELRQLTRDELAYILGGLGYRLDPEDLRGIEQGQTIITVDDLVALAVALEVTPAVLLSHMHSDYPGSGRIAAGVPEDVDQPELRAWIEGRAALDRESRLRWSRDRVARLEILVAHQEDQWRGALEEFGELPPQERGAEPAVAARRRARESKEALMRADAALAYAEQLLEALREAEW